MTMNDNSEKIMRILKKWKEWWLAIDSQADVEIGIVIYAFHKTRIKSCSNEFYYLRLFFICSSENDSAQVFFKQMHMQKCLPEFYRAREIFLSILNSILNKNTKVL